MVEITYRSDLLIDLTAAQVDANFRAVSDAIDDLLANPPEPNSFTSITAEGLTYVFHMADDSTFTLPIPFISQTVRGEWLPFTLYSALDAVTVEGVGGFSALLNHTSGAAFDPDLTIDDAPVWRKTYSDAANAASSAIYDLVIAYQGRLSDLSVPIVIPVLHTITMPSAGAHIANLSEAPSTADQVLPLLHNATQVGTVTVLIGENVGTIVFTADETIAAGEFFSVGLPADADATAAGMSLGFAAQRVF